MSEKTKQALRISTAVMLVLALPIAFASLAWVGSKRTSPEPPKTAAPDFNARDVLLTDIGVLRNYVAQLHFDSVEGAADVRVVDFEQGRFGVNRARLARIEPEEGSYRLSESELAEGRIIARIYTDASYPSLGIGPGWTWWWVDRNGPGGTWRSIDISERLGSKVIRPLTLTYHEGHQWRQAIARFADGASWGVCAGHCCKQRLPVSTTRPPDGSKRPSVGK